MRGKDADDRVEQLARTGILLCTDRQSVKDAKCLGQMALDEGSHPGNSLVDQDADTVAHYGVDLVVVVGLGFGQGGEQER